MTDGPKGHLEGERFMERANGLHFLLAPDRCQLDGRDSAQCTLRLDTS